MNDKAHYVVGEVGFGPNFGAETARVELLEAQVALLRRALERCAALSEEALLATAP